MEINKKIGYTWYPKDWISSENVFELNLSERGLYRELIDLAYINDNRIEIKKDIWCRRFFVDINELNTILDKFINLKIIESDNKYFKIPSCESRLNLIRGGRKGGKNKPTTKPEPKPNAKPDIKPNPKQIKEKETKENINENNEKVIIDFINHLGYSDHTKEITTDWFVHLMRNGKDIKYHQVETFLKTNKEIYGTKTDLLRQDIYYSIERGYFGLFRKNLKEAGFDENTGKKIPQYEGDYTPIPYYKNDGN